ncbi:MAG: hypothetical protein H7Z14_06860 [Anaerolineae bacterium]|nr:hypothetical protein [Phycisphaerae bacterium]
MQQATDSIAQLVDTAARLRMVRDAQRRFLQLWAEQRTQAVTRNLFFPAPVPQRPARRGRTPRRRKFHG